MNQNKNSRSKLTIFSLLLVSSLLVLPFEATQASSNNVVSARNVNAIQTKQAKSIEAGVRIGKLTPKEARKLRKEQHEIISIERGMREDGALNASELSKLFKKLQYAQNHINKLLRNNISTHGTTGRNHKNIKNTSGN